MALKKTKIYQTGIEADYHKITRIEADVLGGNVSIQVSTFLNKAARDSGKWPVENQVHNFSGADYFIESNSPQNLVELSYLKIKERVEFFSDAVDC